MNSQKAKTHGRRRIFASISLAGAMLMTAAGTGLAHAGDLALDKGLEGTWFVQVTLRDCATTAALGSFNSLVTFNRGGTLSESTSSPVFAIGQRSSGHGTWDREDGHTYGQRIVSLINFSTAANLPGTPGFNPALPVSPGFFAGWATVTHTIDLGDSDHGTSSGTNQFYKADGTQYRTGCSTATLARFE